MLVPSRRAVLAMLIAALPLAGCSSPGGADAEPPPPAVETPSGDTEGLSEAESQFVTMVNSIVGGAAAGDPERVLRRGENVCLDLEQGKDEAVAVGNAQQRFSGTVELSEEQARKVVETARTTICSS
jgi:hypothetical protein